MTANIDVTPGTGKTVATDEVGGFQVQQVKVVYGASTVGVRASVGAGAVDTGTPRYTHASDDPVVTNQTAVTGTKAPGTAAASALLTGGVYNSGGVTLATGQQVAMQVTSAGALKATLYDATGTAIDFTAASPVTQSGAWTVSNSSVGFDVQTTITRPANITAYTANDVLGAALDLGVLGASAAPVLITSIQLEADIAAIPSGQTSWVLHLYSVTPPSALADNAAWDLPSGDRASYLGQVALTTLVDQGSTLYMESNGINKQVRLAGTHLFGYLVTVGGFTPAANSEVYKITVHTVGL